MEDSGIFYGHLVDFVVIWCISPRVGKLYRENLATLAGQPALSNN
jgi:hypothetical protein